MDTFEASRDQEFHVVKAAKREIRVYQFDGRSPITFARTADNVVFGGDPSERGYTHTVSDKYLEHLEEQRSRRVTEEEEERTVVRATVVDSRRDM